MSGIASKNSGIYFETFFTLSCQSQGIHIYRLPDCGAKFIGKNKIIKKQIICDFILSYNDSLFLIDTKTIAKNKLSYSDINSKSFFNQLIEMDKLQENLNKPRTGFVVHFSKLDVISFFNTKILLNLSEKKALSYKDGLILKEINSDDFNIRRIF